MWQILRRARGPDVFGSDSAPRRGDASNTAIVAARKEALRFRVVRVAQVLPPFCFAALRDTAPWNALIYALFVGCTTFIFGFATAYNESEGTLQAMIAITITVATLTACALQTERYAAHPQR